MRKKNFVLWFLLALFAFAVMAGGCGDSSDGDWIGGDDPTNPVDPPNLPDPDDPGRYEPPDLTEEVLEQMAREAIHLELDELVFSDGTQIKDYLNLPSPVLSVGSGVQTASTFTAGDVKIISAKMQARAHELTQLFPAVNLHHGETDKGEPFIITQNRYVYVYPAFSEEYGRVDIPILQYLRGPEPPHPNIIKDSGYCDHPIYGMDCVGFLYQCIEAAEIPALKNMGGKWGVNTIAMGTESTWHDRGLTTAREVSTAGLPEPGDVLSWNTHVGIAVKSRDGGIAVIHSSGRTSSRYYCSEFKEVAYRENPNETLKTQNGPAIHKYTDAAPDENVIPGFKREARRLRLGDIAEEPDPVEPPGPFPPDPGGNWIDVADTSWYDNNPNATTFTINTPYELAGLAKLVNGTPSVSFGGKTIRLGADINLAGREWTPIGSRASSFTGIFDGEDRTISNMTITGTLEEYAGLFGNVTSRVAAVGDAVVKNVRLANVNIDISTTHQRHGGVVGYFGYGRIENCTFSGDINVYNTRADASGYVGGIVGYTESIVTNCESNGNITLSGGNSSYAGGIVGSINGTRSISNCRSNVNVSSSSSGGTRAGGIVGSIANGGTVSNSYSKGNVSSTSSSARVASYRAQAGGIVGFVSGGNVEDCHKLNGTVSAVNTDRADAAYAGGVIGYLSGNRNLVSVNTYNPAAADWGIGYDSRTTPPGRPSNDGATPAN